MQTIYLSPWEPCWYLNETKPSYQRRALGTPIIYDSTGFRNRFVGFAILWHEDKQCYSDGGWSQSERKWVPGSIVGKSAKRTCKRVDDKYLGHPVGLFKQSDNDVLFVALDQKRWDKLSLLL
jgi:hypothetical protein